MNDSNTFMAFWATMNNLLKSHQQPELGYGEAKSYWIEFNVLAHQEAVRAAKRGVEAHVVDPWRRDNPISA
jgi:hypothetical protein